MKVVRAAAAGGSGAAGVGGGAAQGLAQGASRLHHSNETHSSGDSPMPILSIPLLSFALCAHSAHFLRVQVAELLTTIVSKKICSRRDLMRSLALDPQFLCNEVQAFLRPAARKQFRIAWSRLADAAAAEVDRR